MKRSITAIALFSILPPTAGAQMAPRPSGPPLLTASNPVVQRHIDAALAAAGPERAALAGQMCNLAIADKPDQIPMRDTPATMPEVANWPEQPAKIFDNVYFVGSKGVSAFAIKTEAGIIITDAMWSYDVARSVVGGLETLGLDPRQIRYVIIPHGHPDHYGGAQYLHDNFGAKIVAPRGDLALIAKGPSYDTTPIPKGYDRIIDEGDSLVLGGTRVDFTVVPGHTDGGVVLRFPVMDKGKPHRMLIWSAGGATPGSAQGQTAQAAALERLLRLARSERIDALAENHGSHVLADQMRENAAAANPFLIGQASVEGYLTMRRECDLARAANTAALSAAGK